MTVGENRERIDRNASDISGIKTTIQALGGMVGKAYCQQTEGRVMDAVDRLNRTTERLTRDVEDIRKETRNYRVQRLATLVGVLVSVILMLLNLYLREHG